MLSFPVVFVSSARESDRNRVNMGKRGGDFSIEDSNSDTETDREEPIRIIKESCIFLQQGTQIKHLNKLLMTFLDGKGVCLILIGKKIESHYFL